MGSVKGRKVIIVGAGIGGLAAATALARQGAMVTVLEQAEAITEAGAGIQVSPNGFAVLRALGLAQEACDLSTKASGVCLYDYQRGPVLPLDMAGGQYRLFHRADLIDLLHWAARRAGVRVLLLQKVREVVPGSEPLVRLASGAELCADLVVGADGLHSVLRQALNGDEEPFFTGQVAWRAVIDNPTERRDDVTLHMAPHRHLVTYPLRQGRQLNIVAVQERAAWVGEDWRQQDDPEAVRAAFADFAPDVRALLDRIETVHLWGLFRHRIAPVWHREGVALLGDALHPTLPFLAQGANMALEDGWVLAEALGRAEAIEPGLAEYRARREARVARVVRAASGNARKYHLAFPPLRWAARTGLRMAGRVAPGMMLRSFDWLYGVDVTEGSAARSRK